MKNNLAFTGSFLRLIPLLLSVGGSRVPERGREPRRLLFLRPVFPSSTDAIVSNPDPNTWYRVVLSNVDFSNFTYDVAVFDKNGNELGNKSDVPFMNDVSSVSRFRIRNHMNSSDASAWIDHIKSGK